VTAPVGQRLGVRRQGIAVIRQLQRAEAEHRRGRGGMAGQAVGAAGDGVTTSFGHLVRAGYAAGGRQFGVTLLFVPHVGGEHPLVGRGEPQQARLDLAAVPGELLPQLRADGEAPGVGVGHVDARAVGQVDPARLVGTVGPQRVLRREGAIAGGDRAVVTIETRLREPPRGGGGVGRKGAIRGHPFGRHRSHRRARQQREQGRLLSAHVHHG
jgi:hypothetical protein